MAGSTQPHANGSVRPMGEDRFWSLIEAVGPRDEDIPAAAARLRALLEPLTAMEITSFADRFAEKEMLVYRYTLWGACYLMSGGCSDDSFAYWSVGLVMSGPKTFEEALRNPDSLADLNPPVQRSELIMYVAGTLFEERTGEEDMPSSPGGTHADLGEDWDFDDKDLMRAKYPRLCARFGF